ncbi:uncharacterized protein LOC18432027 isoform X1 [Amborella trichopoda]|nr:uncharacterized protein LOC18432027 isoform X1 [Amborella trichopoda]|eukprot:XP_011622566.1 uncharacterized protein LOC18432027 isoform X1 [Amborella trichopoda]
MKMVGSSGSDLEGGLAVLQLQNWSHLHIDLSEFNEFFISPTRELLLLLSYQCDALLLPLMASGLSNRLSSSKAAAQADLNKPDTLYDTPYESDPINIPNSSLPAKSSSSSAFKHHPVISDVKSLAWGCCGDAYNQNTDARFKELLFVAGDRGVTVHAFRCLNQENETSELVSEGFLEEGRWVEWGPWASSNCKARTEELVSSVSQNDGNVWGTNAGNGNEEQDYGVDREADYNKYSQRNVGCKRWLQTFLTEIETIESGGKFLARFPANSSFPCIADVISFSILYHAPKFLDFLHNHDPALISKEKERQEVDIKSLYKCSKVFSSSSHRLIGMVLTSEEPSYEDTSAVDEKWKRKVFVVVAMLHNWGIQWVSSVKLHSLYQRSRTQFEWADFQLSDDFLICLDSSGLIFIWGSTTGKLVTSLDVLKSCGINSKPQCLVETAQLSMYSENFSSSRLEEQTEQFDEVSNGTSLRKFKKLLVASNSLLLAVTDKYGLTYVIAADDYIPENDYMQSKLIPNFEHYGLGVLANWKLAGSDIGSHKMFQSHLESHIEDSSYKDDIGSKQVGKKGKWHKPGCETHSYLHGFSCRSWVKGGHPSFSDTSLTPSRRVFLPIEGSNKEDSIFFTALGITRIVRKCIVNNGRGFKIMHSCLHLSPEVLDDRGLDTGLSLRKFCSLEKEYEFVGKVIGCSFQGCVYFVSKDGLFIVLPSISVPSDTPPAEYIEYWRPISIRNKDSHLEHLLVNRGSRDLRQPWQIEILDRALVCESPEVVGHLCLENGWGLKVAWIRRLQLALDYANYDEIEKSLDMLIGVNAAEEGIMRLLFTVVERIFCRSTKDHDLALASRLLALAARFATKMIRRYGLLEHKRDKCTFKGSMQSTFCHLEPPPIKKNSGTANLGRLREMAHFLEVIRNLQNRLGVMRRRPGTGAVDTENASALAPIASQDDLPLPQGSVVEKNASGTVSTLEAQNPREVFPQTFPESEESLLALSPLESVSSTSYLDSRSLHELFVPSSMDGSQSRPIISFENAKDMIARWEMNKLDLKSVVKDALSSGRLPLAVLQLHIQHLKERGFERETRDIFNEVQDVGRAIAYDMFCKGEAGLAIATLQRLGEDIEVSLKELVFGTVRRNLRTHIAEELKRLGYLASYELRVLDRLSLIERLYPSSSFWGTYVCKPKQLGKGVYSVTLVEEDRPRLVCYHSYKDHTIECGEIDGAVIGSWANIDENLASVQPSEEDNIHAGYWAGAAVWCDAWDQRIVDRIVLDQPFLMGVHVLWESQLEYYMCHNDWVEVSRLLDTIPSSLLADGSLQIQLDVLHSFQANGEDRNVPRSARQSFSSEELDSVYMTVPNIKLFHSSSLSTCSQWLRMHMEQKLARKLIFLKGYWKGTWEIMPLLSRAGFIVNTSKISVREESSENLADLDFSSINEGFDKDALLGLHRVVVHYCAEYNLPNLLDLYLDHHKLAFDDSSMSLFQEAAGDCMWAKWLLLSRIKGFEYDASFANARAILSHNLVPGNNLCALEIDDIIRTIDDIAEGGGEIAALATLMYASVPLQNFLCSGSVNRHCKSSAQCTLENLRPGLQHFPTLWHTLVAACFGQDLNPGSVVPNIRPVFGKSALADYLNWRDKLFSSSGGDTSLLQMLPCWVTKAVRRLIQLSVQGPIGRQSFSFANSVLGVDSNGEFSAVSWEAAVQKHIEEELYASSFEENGHGIEHHLHRGRALAAFHHLLGVRAQRMRTGHADLERKGSSTRGSTNVQSDSQRLLTPLTQNEESLLSSVIPLATLHFEDPVLVASCALLLELCGQSASTLRVDVAALRRISSFYKSMGANENLKQFSPKDSPFHVVSNEGEFTLSLAQSLADDYLDHDNVRLLGKRAKAPLTRRHSRVLETVLQHLEKASLPVMIDGQTCGSWLLSGKGDGAELRSQQKAASQYWNLVTTFCQMHHLPISTKYLAALAKDNDWVGFLTEAQLEGCQFDVLIQVASKEFTDPRLKCHILTVLKSMSTKAKSSSTTSSASTGKNNGISTCFESMIPVELFELVAEAEKQKNSGEALLLKAKDLRWSLLAMIASCFPDVSPITCLTVWLEITAASETSSIKVNDISSQITANVAAAVEATNTLPNCSRELTIRYNRRKPKRRRLMETVISENTSVSSPTSPSFTSPAISLSLSQGVPAKEARKKQADEMISVMRDPDDGRVSLSKMVAILCEQRLFLPLLRAFEMFIPSCVLVPFIRSLQAFSQMRLSEASAHLASFSARIKEEPQYIHTNIPKDEHIGTTWITATAVKAADAMLSTCPSAYEKRCLLKLLSGADFGDGGSASAHYRRLYWKINLAEPSLRQNDGLCLGDESLDDAGLLTALEKIGHWEQARTWAQQLELSGPQWRSAAHHVTEMQAEAMVAEWKEFLWDVPEEKAALWGHCQTLFLRYSFPGLQAGLFFLKHADAVEKDIPARELHEMLLLSLQWLSGSLTQSLPVYPLHLLREIETRVWLLAVESEAQVKAGRVLFSSSSNQDGNETSIIEKTASIIAKMDSHLQIMRTRTTERSEIRENNQVSRYAQISETSASTTKTKRRAKGYLPSRRFPTDTADKNQDNEDSFSSLQSSRNNIELFKNFQLQEENIKFDSSVSGWEERVGPAELERAVLSLLEFGQITAAKQLQQKLSPSHVPTEIVLVDVALKLASISTPGTSGEGSLCSLDSDTLSVMQSYEILDHNHVTNPLQALETLTTKCTEGSGRGLCMRIIAVVKAANVLGLTFSEAFQKRPIELLQLLSLKAQDSLEEAKLLLQTHFIPPSSIARILAESFLKGLLAAHRGGYMDSQKEEGPAPLLWRLSDFIKWADLCPSEPEIGHALMRLVITGHDIPHACEVELLILSHHFYKSSACLDGVDVLVALAATRVESYVAEGDFSCLARLVTGVSNFHALHFILDILIENGQLELLLQKFSVADSTTGAAEAVRGFRMAVLSSLKHFNPHDLDAFAMVYNHFDMKYETSSLLESRARRSLQQWFLQHDRERSEELLDSMRFYVEAAESYSTIDAGNKTRQACAQASLTALQIRMPDHMWLNLSETNARRALVEQARFPEALAVAEAYGLNQPSEWVLVIWNQMLRPDIIEAFLDEFVAALPLLASMLLELARFYRSEVTARGEQSQLSAWLTPGGLPIEWARHLGRSFRALLKRTRDLRVRMQVAAVATGFRDVVEVCATALDRVPESAGPLVLRKGHGGAYLPLM